LASTGLYFSLRFKHTTTAVIANMGLAAALWGVGPLFLAILVAITRGRNGIVETYLDLNPFVQTVIVILATTSRGGTVAYDWMQSGMSSWFNATGWMLLTFTVYGSLGLIFLTLAAGRLRRDPF
jgi:hypothetical protein